MELKYIVLRKGYFHRPIFFMEPVTHIGMMEACLAHPEFAGHQLASAGFFDTDKEECYGESESLRLAGYKKYRSRPKDTRLIRGMPYNAGII